MTEVTYFKAEFTQEQDILCLVKRNGMCRWSSENNNPLQSNGLAHHLFCLCIGTSNLNEF